MQILRKGKEMNEDKDYIHAFFGLSYAKYLVLPRSILQSMPEEWQRDFVKLLEQLDTNCTVMNIQMPDYSVSAKKGGKFIKDPYRDYWRNGQRCQGLRNFFSEVADDRTN